MKRKILALLLSLAMLLSIGGMVEGTLAVGISVDSTRSSVTLGEVDTVVPPASEDEPTVEPEATVEPTPAPTVEPKATVEPTPTPTVEPEATVEPTPAPTVEPAETETPEECTCDPKPAEGEAHKEGCPLKEELADNFNAAAEKEKLLGFVSTEEVEAYLSTLTDDQLHAVADLFTEAEIREFAEQLGIDVEIKIITPPVNYTRVGPLMDAVQTAPQRRNARSISRAVQEENGLILNKTAVFDPETSKITITMEAYTTGTVTSSAHSIPVDIVLVLDESGSMADPMQSFEKVYQLDKNETYYVKSGNSYTQVKWCDGWGHSDGWYKGFHILLVFHIGEKFEPKTSENDNTSGHVQFYKNVGSDQSKREALIQAATAFTDKVNQDATDNDVDHRISVIGFSGDGKSNIKVGLSDDIRNNVTAVRNAIAGINANGGTYIEDGMTNARSAFDNAANTSATERKRVVIVFTDGIPGSGTWNDSTIKGSANPAIATAKTLKGSYGATIYTIGMLTDADPELEISDENTDTARTNRFLHYVSSNYPNAQSMADGGTGSNKGYYLSASDTESLNAIFEKISQEIAVPTIPLGSAAVIKDIIAPSFNVPADADNISLYTEDYDGTQFDGTRDNAPGVTATISGDTISVTGFDFNANFVSDTAKSDGTYGKKLIIEFTVTPKGGFLGGNNVVTNGENSGVYDKEGNKVEAFPLPQVNVPIQDVTVTAADKNVYLLGGLTAAQLKEGAVVKCGDVTLSLAPNATNYGLADWQTAYVDITVEVKDKDGNAVTDLNALTADTTYTISVTVAPKTDGAGASGTPATAKSGVNSPAANINVFKPVLTFKDSEVYYGDDVPSDFSGNKTSEVWKHNTTISTDAGVVMTGEKPTLSLTYTPDSTKIKDSKVNTKQDIPVDVTVGIGGTDVTGYTTFNHTACNPACRWNETTLDGSPAFLLHVKTCQLTITKKGGAANEPYVFTVKKDGTNYTEVTIVGNGSATIYELPVGTYTIEEDTGWSWRFTPTIGSDVALNAKTPTGEITCTNTLNEPYWLNGFSAVVKNVFNKSSN